MFTTKTSTWTNLEPTMVSHPGQERDNLNDEVKKKH